MAWDHPSHRSINSGFELALKKWIQDRPDLRSTLGTIPEWC